MVNIYPNRHCCAQNGTGGQYRSMWSPLKRTVSWLSGHNEIFGYQVIPTSRQNFWPIWIFPRWSCTFWEFFLLNDRPLSLPSRYRSENKDTCIANLDATHTQLCKEQGRQTVRATSSWEWIFWKQEVWETEKTFYRLYHSTRLGFKVSF